MNMAIDMYDGDPPEHAVQAIRVATKLGNKEACEGAGSNG
jgi:hypothetical protein